MTRDGKKPITDESYNHSGMFTLAPNGAVTGAVRYPAAGTTFPNDTTVEGAVDYFVIRNLSGADIRVVNDGDADASTGHAVHAGEDYGHPVTASEYISLYGGDGTSVEIHWYRW
jgi:hypothetical protein